MIRKYLLTFFVSAVLLAGCGVPESSQPDANARQQGAPPVLENTPTLAATDIKEEAAPAEVIRPTVTQSPTETPFPTEEAQDPPAAALQASGPDNFPAGVNPLTGLPVKNPENLLLPPALVSITNFPVSARPQAGLSFSPFVFEMYIGQGDSRFLALFYGDYPEVSPQGDGSMPFESPKVGPIRSGRLPYEPLRKQYNGFLVMASAFKSVAANLSQVTNIFGSDASDINSALIDVTKLEDVARSNQKRLGENAMSGLRFDPAAPDGGVAGTGLWLPYSYLNQIIWRYNPESGAYNRYQDQADGTNFKEFTDRLNGNPLAYDNVVILFADHHAYYETVIDIDLQYIDKMPALLFRDGKMYNIFWTTRNEAYEKATGKIRPIRFIDAEGNPVPLKPGQTWVEIVPRGTQYNETVDSQVYFDLAKKQQPGSGMWAIHFVAPPIEGPPAAN